MLSKVLYRILFAGWLVFVTFASLSTFETSGSSLTKIPHFDKFVHFIFYFIMVILGVLAVREYLKTSIKFSKVMVCVLLFAVIYGIIIEVLQYTWTINRQGDILDALANTVGALLGMWVARILFSRKWSLK
ncbi:VanZ family protein [Maribacter aestuarii]|uniref:VanZ family protein n=1 Tax=Maribacter aestuarii TaxID=1130723 RepID=UPI00248B8089|nr:VanZ family protein [Maribacter aestuarii]